MSPVDAGRGDRRVPMALLTRRWTPDEKVVDEEGKTVTRIRVKRACNGCGALLGDVTDQEMSRAISGLAPLDVTNECPFCQRSAK